ncbi:hypothetical protein D9M68_816990 [compost metagenome]
MPLAQCQDPGGGHAHARAQLHFLGGQLIEPLLNPAELATYRDLVQAALNVAIGLFRLARPQELASGLLEKRVFLEPARRPLMQALAVLR